MNPPKFKIGDKVIINWNHQVARGEIMECKSFKSGSGYEYRLKGKAADGWYSEWILYLDIGDLDSWLDIL